MDDFRRPGRRTRGGRLSRSAEFERVYRQGRSHGNRYLVLHAFPRTDSTTGDDVGATRLGLSVSRKVGGAVVRNRVKRLAREAFDLEAAGMQWHTDVVIVARPEARDLAEREGLDGFRRELAELIAKASGDRPAT